MNRDPVRQISGRVAQILYLAGKLLRILVDQDQLVRNALYGKGIRDMRAHMPKTDHTETSFPAHSKRILSDMLTSQTEFFTYFSDVHC